VAETFETAVTWDRFWECHEGVLAAVEQAVRQACGGGAVSCRFAYVYPDGPAPYCSVYAPGRLGQELEQWDQIKLAVSEAILALGGTITHHHAVGRDHRQWYLGEAPTQAKPPTQSRTSCSCACSPPTSPGTCVRHWRRSPSPITQSPPAKTR